MADLKYYDIILEPVVTEKSMNAMADKKYTFYVHVDATKAQIKEAVEKMFEGTKVGRVNTMNLEGKTRRREEDAVLHSERQRRERKRSSSSQRTARTSRSSQAFKE